ncbi:hypothetical protein CW304_19145 [Bacillus sp. UFRGS-B20]|nr:hypothetical protein CW304_19145 [Bacillus sp. UFRGS-B20]
MNSSIFFQEETPVSCVSVKECQIFTCLIFEYFGRNNNTMLDLQKKNKLNMSERCIISFHLHQKCLMMQHKITYSCAFYHQHFEI